MSNFFSVRFSFSEKSIFVFFDRFLNLFGFLKNFSHKSEILVSIEVIVIVDLFHINSYAEIFYRKSFDSHKSPILCLCGVRFVASSVELN